MFASSSQEETASTDPFTDPDNLVTDAKAPANATFNLYDYWLTAEDASDVQIPGGWRKLGINYDNNLQKDRQFKIGGQDAVGANSINGWVGGTDEGNEQSRAGIVQNKLGDDGYPVLSNGLPYVPVGQANNSTYTVPTQGDESLAYLFDTSEVEGKRAYRNVSGLVQYIDGYYTYDSFNNFASLDKNTNRIRLYKQSAVEAKGSVKGTGQFFPFEDPSEVFDVADDGSLIAKKDVTSQSDNVNHYFGADLTVDFTQPAKGIVGNKPMTFTFSGDDDVWVFIDGVLVGDVGGVHGANRLSIDFKTGEVEVMDARDALSDADDNLEWEPRVTTIRQCFVDALGQEEAEKHLQGDTFKDNSYHTLRFFYLERGGSDSNMHLSFNLQRVTQSMLEKDDQEGNPVAGAEFELYASDENFSQAGELVSRGVTSSNGTMLFMDLDGKTPIDFAKLASDPNGAKTHFILRETKTPEGYRTSSEGHLKYYPSRGDGQKGFLLSENEFDSGVFARPNQITVMDTNEVVSADGKGTYEVTENDTVFAVVYKRDNVVHTDVDDWHAVSGERGAWKVADAAMTKPEDLDAVWAAGAAKPFVHDGTQWSVDFGELPGGPESYRFMASPQDDPSSIHYSIGYYLVKNMTPSEISAAIERGEHPIGTHVIRLDSTGKGKNFTRESYATLHVTDVADGLTVQKVDDMGQPVNGVVFDAYRSDQVSLDEAGNIVPKPGQLPVASRTTADMRGDELVGLDGACRFSRVSSQSTYYIIEREALPGYEKNTNAIRVINTGEGGLFADAGVEGDGITVRTTAGSLVDSMDDFGSNDGVEVSLHDVVASKCVARVVPAGGDDPLSFAIDSWDRAEGDQAEPDLHLRYKDDSRYHDYVVNENHEPQSETNMFLTDTGVIRAAVRQDPNPCTDMHGIGTWVDLGDKDLSKLFVANTVVTVANERVASLEVEKQVIIPSGLTGPEDWQKKDFTFAFELKDKDGKPLAGSVDARVFKTVDGQEVQQGSDFKLALDASGKGSHTLKHGETIKLYGLSDGAQYTVSEPADGQPAGFVQTQPSDNHGGAGVATGSVKVGEITHRVFENTWSPTSVEVTDTTLGVKKNFNKGEGFDEDPWTVAPDAKFTFVLQASKGTPMPEGSVDAAGDLVEYSVTVDKNTKDYTAFFPKVAYSAPGTYTYVIFERTPAPENRVPGVTYSDAAYRVAAEVTDDGTGALKVAVSVVQTDDDTGGALTDQEPLAPGEGGSYVAAFNNSISRTNAKIGPLASKLLNGRDFVDDPDGTGEFTFRMQPVGDDAATQPMPNETQGEGANRYIDAANTGDTIGFGQSTYTHQDVDATPFYYYELWEVVPDDAVNDAGTTWADADEAARKAGGFKYKGVTYDSTHYVAKVVLSMNGDKGEFVNAEIEYYKGWFSDGVDNLVPVEPSGDGANRVTFENTYEASTTYAGFDLAKTLSGRDMKDEEFTFTVSGFGQESKDFIDNQGLSAKPGDGYFKLSTPGAANGAPALAEGVELTFTQADAGKTYIAHVSEDVPNQALPHVTYDKTVYHVELAVSDNLDGTLKVTPKVILDYDQQGNARFEELDLGAITNESGRAQLDFNNVYGVSATYAGIDVTKQLTGRSWKDSDSFKFTMDANDFFSIEKLYTSIPVDQYRSEIDFSISQPESGDTAKASKLNGLQFTQDDIGQTFTYHYVEVVPGNAVNADGIRYADASGGVQAAGGFKLMGVEYTNDAYLVDITPRIDDGTGDLYTVTEVWRGKRGMSYDAFEFMEAFDSRKGEVAVVPFANTYASDPAPASLTSLTKALEGRDWQEGDAFEFSFTQTSYQKSGDGTVLAPGDEGYVAGPVIENSIVKADSPDGTLSGTKSFGFHGVEFSTPGVYDYEVREVVPTASDKLSGIEYSDAVAKVRVRVVDLGVGRLFSFSSVLRDDASKPDFVNVYKPQDATASVDGLFSKTLAGRDWRPGDEFVFEMRPDAHSAGAPLPGGAIDAATATVTADNAASFGFGSITYTQADLAGVQERVFGYDVREVVPGDAQNADGVVWADATDEQKAAGGFVKNGITYDGHVAHVSVHVADDRAAGKLTATAAVDAETSSAFENAYAAKGELAVGGTKKLVGTNDSLKEGAYTFNLDLIPVTPDGGEGGKQPIKLASTTNAADGSFGFTHELTLDELHKYVADGYAVHVASGINQAKVHQLRLRVAEDTSNLPGGITAEKNFFNVVVTVTDNGDGILKMDYSHEDGENVIVNAYSTNDVKIAPVGVKQLVRDDGLNPPDIAGKFTFTLTADESNPDAPLPDNAHDGKATTTNTAEGKVEFGAITFTRDMLQGAKERVFTYHVTESGSLDGIANDNEVKTFTYTLTDDGEGRLSVSADPADGPVFKFVNVYGVAAAEVSVNAMKTVTGEELAEGAYTFELAPTDGQGEVQTATNGADGSVSFALSYNRPGTYRYTLRELPGDRADMTYDANVYHVVVTVSDAGTGKLASQVEVTDADGNEVEGSAPTFTNVVRHTEAAVAAKKEMTGRPLTAGEFNFVLTPLDGGQPLVASNDADGNVTFAGLAYDAVGEYVYTLSEAHDAAVEGGVTFDDTVYTVVVRVTEDGAGGITSSASVYKGTESVQGVPTFKNAYEAVLDYSAMGGLTLTKQLNGRDMTAGQFEFTVEAKTTDTVEAQAAAERLGFEAGKTSCVFASHAAADGEVDRIDVLAGLANEHLVFTQADAGKTFAYHVSESKGGDAGYTNDTTVYDVTIGISDDGAGTLTVTTTVAGGADGPWTYEYKTGQMAADAKPVVLPFVNSYAAKGVAPIKTVKTLNGRPLAADEFSFELRGGDNVVATAKNAADGTVDFGTIEYTVDSLKQAVRDGYVTRDADGVWHVSYIASEMTDGLPGGVSATTPSFPVEVTVTDKGDGTLEATVGELPKLGFVNTYSTGEPVPMNLAGMKKLDYADGLTPADITGKFTFTVTGEPGAPMPARTEVTNAADGSVDFGAITFTLDDLNRKWEAEHPAVQEEGAQPSVAASESGAVAGDAGAVNGDVASSGDAAASARDTSARIGGPRSATFTYTVAESGSVAGVTNDPVSTRTVAFTVADDGAGNLTVTRDPADVLAFTFTNTYAVEELSSSVTDQVKIAKELSGKPLVEGAYTFALTERVDDGSGAGNTVLTATNDAAGNVVFPAIAYTKPGVHVYTLAEVPGEDGGMTYDSAVYTVRTTVTDNGDGTLSAKHEVLDANGQAADAVVFHNVYEPAPATAPLAAGKTFTGRDLAAGEFNFELVDADGTVLQTVANDAAGNVVFEPLTFTVDDLADAAWVDQDGVMSRALELDYTVREVVPDDAVNADGVRWADASADERAAGGFAKDGVTYDSRTFAATVVVSDNGSGALAAIVSWDAQPVFQNAYEKPGEPGGGTQNPQGPASGGSNGASGGLDSSLNSGDAPRFAATGDPMSLWGVAALAVSGMCIVALATALALRKGR